MKIFFSVLYDEIVIDFLKPVLHLLKTKWQVLKNMILCEFSLFFTARHRGALNRMTFCCSVIVYLQLPFALWK